MHTTEDISLRHATMDDSQLVYNWQMVPNIRKYSRTVMSHNYNNHLEWMNQKISDDKCDFFICLHLDSPAGFVRLDTNSNEDLEREVSILVSPDYQKKGIANAALSFIREQFPQPNLVAYIDPRNIGSIKLFAKAGYKKISDERYINYGR